MPHTRCSIIVPVYNRASLTDQILRRLLAEEHRNTEIVVVDDASTDSTQGLLESYGDRIRVVRHDRNEGFASSCNDGAAAAEGEYLVFLNNDTYPHRGWLDALAAEADAHPEAAAVGAKLLHPNGTVQHAGIVFTSELLPRHVYTGFPATHPAVNVARTFKAVTAAAMLVRRGPFFEVRGFDTEFVNSYEDIDLCLRLGELGHEIRYTPRAVLEHLDTVTRDFRDHGYNERLYRNRWENRIQADDFAYYIEDGLVRPEYWEQYPLKLEIAPELAVLNGDGDRRDELLVERSEQVFSLLRENVRLKAELLELRGETPSEDPGPAWRPPAPAGAERLVFPKHRRPRVSIVIPVHNGWEYTYSCLQSLLEHAGETPFEVIVADDASGDETRRIRDVVENVAVSRSREPKGFLRNCNEAARSAKGDYVLFLNNDTRVTEGWLEPLVEVLDEHDDVAVVGSRLVYPTGRLQEAGGIIWSDGTGLNYGRFDDPDKAEYAHPRDVDYVSGAALMVRRSFWKDVGGFDEQFAPGYYEDADLAFTARDRGYRVRYEPASTVVHYEGISHGRDPEAGVKQYEQVNRPKFVAKWRETLEREHQPPGRFLVRARDRSATRGMALVIDHQVPEHDKDAGSRATHRYIKLLRELGYGVVLAGDDFAAHQPYTDELTGDGVTVLHGRWYSENFRSWLRDHAEGFDYIQLHRPQIAWRYIDLLRKHAPAATIVYVAVDLHHLREQRRYALFGHEGAKREAERLRDVELGLVAKADVTYVYSRAEESLIKAAVGGAAVRTVPLGFYDVPDLGELSLDGRQHILFVGGFRHPPNVDAVQWFAREVLPLIRTNRPDARLVVAGSNPPPEITELAGDGIEVTGYVSDERLAQLYDGARVVVAPLLYGAGMKGKVLEALANGVPVVTTTVGAEGLGAEQGWIVADEAPNFAAGVERLYADAGLWHTMSRGGRRYIAEHQSREAAIDALEHDLLDSRTPAPVAG